MKSLRATAAALPKGSEQKEAIKAMIAGLAEENDSNRSAVRSMNQDFQGKAASKKKDIAAEREALANFHEHGEHCDHESIDPNAQLFVDQDFLKLSRMFNNKFITELQNECRTAEDYARMKQK